MAVVLYEGLVGQVGLGCEFMGGCTGSGSCKARTGALRLWGLSSRQRSGFWLMWHGVVRCDAVITTCTLHASCRLLLVSMAGAGRPVGSSLRVCSISFIVCLGSGVGWVQVGSAGMLSAASGNQQAAHTTTYLLLVRIRCSSSLLGDSCVRHALWCAVTTIRCNRNCFVVRSIQGSRCREHWQCAAAGLQGQHGLA